MTEREPTTTTKNPFDKKKKRKFRRSYSTFKNTKKEKIKTILQSDNKTKRI